MKWNTISLIQDLKLGWRFHNDKHFTTPPITKNNFSHNTLIPCLQFHTHECIIEEWTFLDNSFLFSIFKSPVGRGCRIHWLHLNRGARPPTQLTALDITLNHLTARLQPWRFWEYVVLLHHHWGAMIQSSNTW